MLDDKLRAWVEEMVRFGHSQEVSEALRSNGYSEELSQEAAKYASLCLSLSLASPKSQKPFVISPVIPIAVIGIIILAGAGFFGWQLLAKGQVSRPTLLPQGANSSFCPDCGQVNELILSDSRQQIELSYLGNANISVKGISYALHATSSPNGGLTISVDGGQNQTIAGGQEKQVDVDGDTNPDIWLSVAGGDMPSLSGRIHVPVAAANSSGNSEQVNLSPMSPTGFQVIIQPTKKQYQRGEPVNGTILVNYGGKPVRVMLVLLEQRGGFSKNITSYWSGSINSSTFPFFSEDLKAFRVYDTDTSSGFVSDMPAFLDEGWYIYTMSVYDCGAVEAKFNISCSLINDIGINKYDLHDIPIIASNSNSIYVKGGPALTVCSDNSQCASTCANCRNNLQLCNVATGTCMECQIDGDCIDGYKCRNNICSQWQCDNNWDCEDNNQSTTDACQSNLCTHTLITGCVNDDSFCPSNCTKSTDSDC